MSTTRNTVGNESTIDKVKDALHLNKSHTTTTDTTGTHTTGTHTHATGTHTGTGAGYSGAGSRVTGSGAIGTGSTNAGPHNSNIANKLDPRVDSDAYGLRDTGASTGPTGAAIGATGYSGTHHTGTAGGLSNSTSAGPHNSNLANKADPRVDSDLDGRGNRHGAATGGIMGASGSHATPGSGTAQNTAGPHNSDTLNKIDPRVDADRDGSNTIGGNRTYA